MSDVVILIASIFPPLVSSIKEFFIVAESDINLIFYCLTFQLCVYFFTLLILSYYLISFIRQKVPIHIFNFVFAFSTTIILLSINIYSFYTLIQKNNLQNSKNIIEFIQSMIYVGIFIFCFFGALLIGMNTPFIKYYIKSAIKKYANMTFNHSLNEHISDVVSKQL